MNAEEMFEKLGYEMYEAQTFNPNKDRNTWREIDWHDEPTIIYKHKLNNNRIWFYVSTQTYISSSGIDVKTNQAITQQMEELGWLEC